jgi:hypothetical protein
MDKERSEMIRADPITYHDDIHSDPMNGQDEQTHYFYGHGARLLRHQLLSLCDQKNALRIAYEKEQLGIREQKNPTMYIHIAGVSAKISSRTKKQKRILINSKKHENSKIYGKKNDYLA